jgi:hypothetical protein
MAEKVSASYRFAPETLDLLERLSKRIGTTKTEVLEDGARAAGALLIEGHQTGVADLREIHRRYGTEGRLVISVALENDQAVGRLSINGEAVEDVRARPWVDEKAGKAHVFVEVDREHVVEPPRFAKIGPEPVLLGSPRTAVGWLPWPPQPNVGIVVELADIERILEGREPLVVAGNDAL